MRLKTLLLGFGLLVLAVGQASAQTFSFGLEAGANFTNFVGNGDLSQLGDVNSAKLGFLGGGFLSLNFGNSFAVRPEILYEQKGEAVSGTGTTTELDYVEVPVLLKFNFGNKDFNPALLIGPSFSLNTVKNVANSGNADVNPADIGAIGGFEVDIDKFLLSGRYELGLENVAQNVDIQNGTITFLVGYSFM